MKVGYERKTKVYERGEEEKRRTRNRESIREKEKRRKDKRDQTRDVREEETRRYQREGNRGKREN